MKGLSLQGVRSLLLSYMYNERGPDEEKVFRAHYLADDVRQVATIVYVAVFFMVCLSVIDISKLDSNPSFLGGLIVRSVLIVVGLALVWILTSFSKPWIVDLSAVIYSTLTVVAILWFHYTAEMSVVRIATVSIVFIFAIHLAFPTYAIYAFVPAVVLLFGDGYLLFTVDNLEFVEQRNVVLASYVASLGIATVSSALLQRSRYHTFSALRKVKTLSGLLPICASCKNVRDDRGFYQQIEEYIQDHSDAEFTHGICPDCARKLYPEFLQAET